jgi:hypothetical protein
MSDLDKDTNPTSRAAPNPDAIVSGAGPAEERRGPDVSAAVAVLLAAWCAAGSLGLMAHPLRLALTYVLLAVAAAILWPWDGPRPRRWWLLGVVGLVVVSGTTVVSSPYELLIVLGFVAWLAVVSSGRRRAMLQTCSLAVLTLALFRLACSSVSSIWLLCDFVGQALGNGVGWLLGVPLNIGATFAGLDFLVLMAALYAGWLWATDGPRRGRAVAAAVAILAVHLLYLLVVAYALDLAALLPAVAEPTFDHPYTPPPWSWPDAVRQLLPWNLPALAAGLHLTVACVMFRWSRWLEVAGTGTKWPTSPLARPRAWRQRVIAMSPYLVAAVLPISATLSLGRTDLSGRRFVANQVGNLNWDRPQYDRYGQAAAGWFGMLPNLVESLGGELRISPDMGAADLSQADVALLVHPTGPVAEALKQRLRDFVYNGGSLLVVAEPYQQQGDVRSGFEDVLAETKIQVRRDVAASEAGGWQHSLQPLSHPVTVAIGHRNAGFGTDTGASLQVRWPARPLVLGRWGWSDPGTDALLTGVSRLEAGERLGDLVLAAEQRWGAGRVLVLGDAHPLTNEGGVRGYGYTGRLLSYLANGSTGPQSPWRQAVTVLLGLSLLGAVVCRPDPARLLILVLVWAVSQASCEAASRYVTRVVPDGRLVKTEGPTSPSRLAYIDASHVSPYSDANWAFDGINGLTLTLMRSGYLTLTLPELSRERLERAAVLVTIAPARQFTADERRELQTFVQGGGTLLCLVGAEEAVASEPLLADFGIRVSPSPVPTTGRWHEPEPLGHVRADYEVPDPSQAQAGLPSVQFYAAWPVSAMASDAQVLVRAPNGQPVVVCRQVGRGRVVVIGDTGFAMNKNLEYVGGEPFDGRYDNANFWRWLISRVTDRPEWSPPVPVPAADASSEEVQP